MGNQNSSSDNELPPPESAGILKDMQVIRRENHQLFGQGAVMKQITNSNFSYLREKAYMDGATMKQKIFELQNREKHQHPNLISVKGIASRQETQMCSTVSKLYVLTEYSEMTLDSKITQQAASTSQSRLFPQQQFIRILLDCAKGLEFAQTNHFRCWNIQSSTIFIDSKGNSQLIDAAVSLSPSLYQQILLADGNTRIDSQGGIVFLNVSLLGFIKALETNQWAPCHDENKSEVYALGICLIELALKKKLIIQIEGEQVDQQLKASLQLIREQYDSALCQVIESMVILDESRRISSTDLVKKLSELKSTQTKPKQEFLNVVKNKGVRGLQVNSDKATRDQQSYAVQETLSSQKLRLGKAYEVENEEVAKSNGKIAFASENIVEEGDDYDGGLNQIHQGIEQCDRRCPDNSQALAARKEPNNLYRVSNNHMNICENIDGSQGINVGIATELAYDRVSQGINYKNDEQFVCKDDLKEKILSQNLAESSQKEYDIFVEESVSLSKAKESPYVTAQNDSKHSTLKYNYTQPTLSDKTISYNKFNEENIILQANHHRKQQQQQEQEQQQEFNILPSDDLLPEEEQIQETHVVSSMNNQFNGEDARHDHDDDDDDDDDGESVEHDAEEDYLKKDAPKVVIREQKGLKYEETKIIGQQKELQYQFIKQQSSNETSANNGQSCIKSKLRIIDTAKICAGILTPYLKQPGESKTAHLLSNLYDRSNSNNYENLRDFKITKCEGKTDEKPTQKAPMQKKELGFLAQSEEDALHLDHREQQHHLTNYEETFPQGNEQKAAKKLRVDDDMDAGNEQAEKKNRQSGEEINNQEVPLRYPQNGMNNCLQGLKYSDINVKIGISSSKKEEELRDDAIQADSPERSIHSRRIVGLQSDTHRQIYQDNSNHSSSISNSHEIVNQDSRSNNNIEGREKIERNNTQNQGLWGNEGVVNKSQQGEKDESFQEIDQLKEQKKLQNEFRQQQDQAVIKQENLKGIEVKRSTQSEQKIQINNSKFNRTSENALISSSCSMTVSENCMKLTAQQTEPKRKQPQQQFKLILPLQDRSQQLLNQAELSQNQIPRNSAQNKEIPQIDNLKNSSSYINRTTLPPPNLRLQSNQSSSSQFTPQKPPSRQQFLENVKVPPPSAMIPSDSSLYSDSFCSFQGGQILVQHYADGSRYEGERQHGMRHGKGRFYYSEGGLYDGQWYANKMQGKGTLYYSSGKIAYEGDWIADKFEGFGVLYNEHPSPLNQCINSSVLNDEAISNHWVKYDGEFKNDQKHGFGTLYLSNSERFQGTFQCDLIHGPGTYFTLQPNTLVNGIWYNNVLMHQH